MAATEEQLQAVARAVQDRLDLALQGVMQQNAQLQAEVEALRGRAGLLEAANTADGGGGNGGDDGRRRRKRFDIARWTKFPNFSPVNKLQSWESWSLRFKALLFASTSGSREVMKRVEQALTEEAVLAIEMSLLKIRSSAVTSSSFLSAPLKTRRWPCV